MTIEDLWASSTAPASVFVPAVLSDAPEPARRYLAHAIAPNTPLASTVRLRMHGDIKIGRWLPFEAEQVIRADRGFLWRATVRVAGIPVFKGFDRFVDGRGEMRWKLFGAIPMVTGIGADITRSADGRMSAESIWLPSVLVGPDAQWTAIDTHRALATFTVRAQSVEFEVDERGRVRSVAMARWGNPGGGAFRAERFGGVLADERTFDGYTIPTRVRVGWYFGTERFESEGEFFRATIDTAEYR